MTGSVTLAAILIVMGDVQPRAVEQAGGRQRGRRVDGRQRAMTAEDIRELPPTVDLVTAGRAFGIGRALAYELAARDEFPCPVRRIGGRLVRVKTSELLTALGIEPSAWLARPGQGVTGAPPASAGN